MKDFFDITALGGDYAKVVECLEAGQNVSCFGMGANERIMQTSALAGKILYLVPDYVSAKRVHELFSQIFGDKAELLPVGTDVLVPRRTQSTENQILRTKVLSKLARGKVKVLVASADALFGLCPQKQDLLSVSVSLEVGFEMPISVLAQRLLKLGYEREQLVGAQGQFAIRGDVVDIFAIGAELPIRLEFFDTQIESMCLFDPETQKPGEHVKKVELVPCTNLILSEDDRLILIKRLEKEKELTQNENFLSLIDNLIFKAEQGDVDYAMDFCFPLIKEKLCSVLDYFEASDTIVIDECKMCYDSIIAFQKEIVSRKSEFLAMNESFSNSNTGFSETEELLNKIKEKRGLGFLKVTNQNLFFKTDAAFSFKTAPMTKYTHSLKDFALSVSSWQQNGWRVFICAGDEAGAKQISKTLENYEVFFDIKNDATLNIKSSSILPILFSNGFILSSIGVVVVGTYDIFAKKQKQQTSLKARENVFSVPRVGDYVVHEIHGIGICEGVTKLTGRFGTKDYIVVRYAGDDKLYIPIDQMDILDRFAGADTPKRLSKIGGADFAAVKEKVRSGVRQMAFDLLKLYAEREAKKGFKFPEDDMLQAEFENAFPYTETEDQLASIAEIKNDMQSGKVMDRLLCGDVGFGKTEVAFRAAFKAVVASKQVAFLAPTTILSEQHFRTAQKRFSEFGARIAVLNRFKTPTEQKRILNDLACGKIDILFGTHRLLSKDVVFKDLGLIVLDEEQKFGVEDKEKLKLLKSNVDVLTLSATPIPRTLHMSLSGIRDVSIISSPPSERLPIQTYVSEQSDATIHDAIMQEVSRGGQVFYLYNRVEHIYEKAEKLKKLCPNVNIVVGHGQLPAKELEKVVYDFATGAADVLLCTTIIENGIDISNANTLIVEDADRFGLSSLYQIRGRVGRGNRVAYAYFLYKPDKVLTEEAYKRLDAISEFTEFGSGFKLAMRDLEIRGSGNVLGKEQHGHLQKVGYDLYCKILAEEVARQKGEETLQNREVSMKVDMDAYIPETYITDNESRLSAYKIIAQIRSIEDKQKIENELVLSFGQLPKETKNLLEIAYIKALARNLEIEELEISGRGISFVFEKGSRVVLSEAIANAVFSFRDTAALDFASKPTIKLKTDGLSSAEAVKRAKDFLILANNFKKQLQN